ncbi:MAG: winged helix DNA-binding domain-containing protein [Luteolibacter sp.]|uniref:winged helix-turn-helix domain-containing protein n=1 Tax=Luteolibacter sp. TaxID=1962973 RepID=UPI003262FD8C
MSAKSVSINPALARRIWLRAQRLDEPTPFGSGPEATRRAVEHLGYVQIDTIHVIERCHHHILHSRIPDYHREHLASAQTVDKSVFEYWTHALSYVPTRDLTYFLGAMKRYRSKADTWFDSVKPADLKKVISRIKEHGALSIRDFDDDERVEKDHAWASSKPSKRALQLAFYRGELAVSARAGMLKTYDLMERHFDWAEKPKPATARQVTAYLLDRALRSQGIVSIDSICHLDPANKKAVSELIDSRVKRKQLIPVHLEGIPTAPHWAEPEILDAPPGEPPSFVHILSPFDPLIIQRKRLSAFFGYDHLFEAYVPAAKRKFGYFALPVLVGERIVAAIDLKADRTNRKLLVQKWTWLEKITTEERTAVDEALHRFERFQFASSAALEK